MQYSHLAYFFTRCISSSSRMVSVVFPNTGVGHHTFTSSELRPHIEQSAGVELRGIPKNTGLAEQPGADAIPDGKGNASSKNTETNTLNAFHIISYTASTIILVLASSKSLTATVKGSCVEAMVDFVW